MPNEYGEEGSCARAQFKQIFRIKAQNAYCESHFEFKLACQFEITNMYKTKLTYEAFIKITIPFQLNRAVCIIVLTN